MKIAFFGAYGSFDYFKIGGAESFTRRLATGLIREGHRADFVIYGAPTSQHKVAGTGVGLYYFQEFKAALEFLVREYEQIITLYLPPRDRLRYLSFRRSKQAHLRFHQVYFSWPDSLIKRKAAFLEARLYPFNGRLFCISPRLLKSVSRWSDRGALLLPPVPQEYFLEPERKSRQSQVRVTYIGRTEPAKGIEEVINLHKLFRNQAGWSLTIYGFHYREHPEAVRMHEWLANQQEIHYVYTPFEGYCREVDDNLARVLADTDILLLPYRRLSSTMDAPVLLCEGMAALCAVITRPWGDIPNLYGPSPFLVKEVEEMGEILKRVQRSPEILIAERRRIFQRNRELALDAASVTGRFLAALDPENVLQPRPYPEPGKERMLPGDLLRNLFERLHGEGIAYAVLRNYEGLPQEPGRDVDLLTGDFAGLQRILYQVAHDSGYRVRIFRRYDSLVKFFLLSTSDDGFASLEIDVAWDIRWKGIPLAPRNFLKKNRLRREQVYTLKPGAEAVVTLTKGLFYHGAVQDKYQASLPAMVLENEGGFISTLAGSLGEPLAHKLAELTNRGAWPELAALAPVLKRQAIWRALAVHPWAQIRDWATFIYWGLWKFIRPGGLLVALIGPDGSGKSTITEGLQQSLKPLFHSSRSCHAHFNILPRLRDLMGFFGFRRSEEESTEAENPEVPPATIGRYRSMLYLLYYTLDYMLGLPVILRARGRGELIIFDRYFYDYLIQKGLSLPPGLLWQVLKIIPQPDAVIYLENDPDTILSRKRELSRQEVERQARVCREIISRLPQGFIIPTVGSPAETVATVTRAIIDRVMLKNPGKNSLIGSSEGRAIFSETL